MDPHVSRSVARCRPGSAGFVCMVGVISLMLLPSAKGQMFQVFELAPLGKDTETVATGINNLGVVVGVSVDAAGKNSPVSWICTAQKAGSPKVLPLFSPVGGKPWDINDLGWVVGEAVHSSSRTVATLWPNSKTISGLHDGEKFCAAYSINEFGETAGYYVQQDGVPGAFVIRDGRFSLLDDSQSTRGGCINDLGTVLANYVSENESRPFLLQNGIATDLPLPPGSTQAEGWKLNNAGQVVGSAQLENQQEEAVLWQNGSAHLLDHLGGGYSSATDLNHFGVIVGVSHVPPPSSVNLPVGVESIAKSGKTSMTFVNEPQRAFIRQGLGAPMKNLNTLIPPTSKWVLLSASAINDKGWIVGHGLVDKAPNNSGGSLFLPRGFLLVPVAGSFVPALDVSYRLPPGAGSLKMGDTVDVLLHANHPVVKLQFSLNGIPQSVPKSEPFRFRIAPTQAGVMKLVFRSLDKSNRTLAEKSVDLTVLAAP
ncbi:MAG: hypothetical protein NW241_18505 [Bacteroidia bacterium]|nr:hypothetical protein [Bacteroidia bacterium]